MWLGSRGGELEGVFGVSCWRLVLRFRSIVSFHSDQNSERHRQKHRRGSQHSTAKREYESPQLQHAPRSGFDGRSEMFKKLTLVSQVPPDYFYSTHLHPFFKLSRFSFSCVSREFGVHNTRSGTAKKKWVWGLTLWDEIRVPNTSLSRFSSCSVSGTLGWNGDTCGLFHIWVRKPQDNLVTW